jgi:hypothetical protein
MNQTRAFNPWPWLPVIVLVGTAIPSLIIVLLAHSMRLGLVEDLPYQASVHYDVDKQARLAFAGAGYRLIAASDGPLRLRFQLIAPTGAVAPKLTQIALYRPDDARCDRIVPWSDPAQALPVLVPHPGLWRVRVEVTIAGRPDDQLLTDETSVDALPGDRP